VSFECEHDECKYNDENVCKNDCPDIFTGFGIIECFSFRKKEKTTNRKLRS